MSPAAPTPRTRVRHGIDLVHLPRLRALLEQQPGLEARLFTPQERAYCNAHADPLPHLAARFAAKEAALKALGLGLSALGVDRRLLEVEVRREGTAPHLALHGRTALAAERLGMTSAALTLSHDGDLALASVVLLTEDPA